MRSLRLLLPRRALQLGVLLLFWLGFTLHLGVLTGNYSASLLFRSIPLADPFAVLQILFAGHLPHSQLLLGAGLVLALYLLLGGRVFCSWVCPVNLLTDLAAWLRRRLRLGGQLNLPRSLRYWILGLALPVSWLSGAAASEWISPLGMLQRELIYGLGLGWLLLAGIFLLDLLVVRQGWCGRICPLGAFYGLLGRLAVLRVGFSSERCDRCMDCVLICPENQVLDFDRLGDKGLILSGDCTNCGRCIEVCHSSALCYTHRFNADRSTNILENSFHEQATP